MFFILNYFSYFFKVDKIYTFNYYMQVYLSGNYISMVKSSLKHTSLPSMVAIFLAIYLIAVLQPSRYSIFHSRDTSIQLSLL